MNVYFKHLVLASSVMMLGAVFSGCGDDELLPPGEIPDTGGADGATRDADAGPTDLGGDTGIRPDTGVDGSSDTGTDTGADSGIDPEMDAGPDTGTDTGVPSGTDTGIDSGTDAGTDVGFDGGMPFRVITSTGSLDLIEGGPSASITVVLDVAPPTEAIITLASRDLDAVTVNPASLTFTPDNYDQPQTITATPVDDFDTRNEVVVIDISAGPFGSYQIPVRVTDDDRQSLVVTPTILTVPELGVGTFQVSLAFEPDVETAVRVASNDVTIAGIDPSDLIFAPADWATPQVVTVLGADDADLLSEATTVVVSSDGLDPVTVEVAVVDTDAQAILVEPIQLALVEGTSDLLEVRLNAQPSEDVQVAVQSSDPAIATVSAGLLTFTSTTWNVSQFITVDSFADDDTLSAATTLMFSSDGLPDVVVPVSVTDDDVQSIVFAPTSLTLSEGDAASIDVSLAFDPLGPVTINLVNPLPGSLSTSTVTLSFDSSDYALPKAVVFSSAQDDNIESESFAVAFVSGAASGVLPVTINDDDVQAILASATVVTVTEGEAVDIGIRLAFRPSSDVTVSVVSSDDGAVASSPGTLTFTSENWSSPQNLTLTAPEDADTVDENVDVTLSASGLADLILSVSVVDEDVLNLSLAPTTLNLSEGGSEGTFTVQLTQQPVGQIAVTITNPDPGAVSISEASLTFDETNWDVPVTVNVTPLSDDDAADESLVLVASATGLSSRSVSVTVDDDDVQSLVVAPTAVTVTEEGAGGSFSVRLAFKPIASVTVEVRALAAGLALSRSSLTFTPDDYATAQSVDVTGPADTNLVDDVIVIEVSSSVAPDVFVQVTKLEDDEQSLVVAPSSLTITEDDGIGGTLSVRLAFAPVGTEVVTLTSSDPTVALSQTALSFTAANFSTPQNVVVTGLSDPNLVAEIATVSVSSVGLASVDVQVTKLDDDSQGLVVQPLALSIDEEGPSGSFTVRLAFEPEASTTVTVTSSDPSVTVSGPLTFTAANYATSQSVTVTGLADVNLVDELVNVTVASPNVPSVVVQVTKIDDDEQSLAVAPTDLTVTEQGPGATFNVSLAFAPSGSVNVSITSPDPTISVDRPSLTFTAANYNTPQTVAVSGLADVNLIDEVVNLAVQLAGVPTVNVRVTKLDDDEQSLVVNPTSLTVVEDGPAGNVSVRLAFQPSADVAVNLVSNDALVTLGSASLTFTSANYATPQNVSVTALSDQNLVDEQATITVSSNGLASVLVEVTRDDDDVQTIVAATSPPTAPVAVSVVEQGPSQTFTVQLMFEPTGPVTVNLSSPDPTIALDTNAIVFNPGDYNTPRPVQVTGLADPNLVNEVVNLTLSSAGLSPASVRVTKVEDDVQAIVVATTPPSDPPLVVLDEDGPSVTFTVRLAFQPASAASGQVNISSLVPGSVSAAPAQLSFTAGNYDTPRAVTLTGLSDVNLLPEDVIIRLTNSVSPTVDVTARKLDDDTQDLLVSETNMTVVEDVGPDTFEVRLAFQPSSPVSTSITVLDTTVANVNLGLLNFDGNNWNVPQVVTVRGTTDLDQVGNESTSISVVLSDPVITRTIDVTVNDDDQQQIIITPASVSVPEGGAGGFTARLAFIPLGNEETLTAVSADPFLQITSVNTFTFDETNYFFDWPIVLAAGEDDDVRDRVVNVTVSSNLATPNAVVPVTVVENDSQAIVRVPATMTLFEGGVGGDVNEVLSFHLQHDPTDPVVVGVTSANLTSVSATPTSRTFTTANYLVDQTSVIAAVQDVDLQDETVVVTIATQGRTGIEAASAVTTVTVFDDDTQSIIPSTNALNVVEDDSTTFTVRLEFQPAAPVVVQISSDNPAAATASPASLTFTPGNYTVPQTVTVFGATDNNLDDTSANLTLSTGALAPPEGAANVIIPVSVEDDDVQVIIAQPIPAGLATSLMEGGPHAQFEVFLQFPPRGCFGDPVVPIDEVSVGSLDPARLGFLPEDLTYDCGDFDIPQQVDVRTFQDQDSDHHTIDAVLAIGAEDNVQTNYPIRILDDEQTIFSSVSFPDWGGATEYTRRANVRWGTTRLVVTAQTADGDAFVFTENRELTQLVVGPTLANSANVAFPVNVADFDGTNFEFFLSDDAGIRFARTSEDLQEIFADTLLTNPNAFDFWPTFEGSSYGLVYRRTENGAEKLVFRSVTLDGVATVESQVTVGDGSPDVRPNLFWNGVGYTVVYTSGIEVRCVRLTASGAIVPGSDVSLPTFPPNGPFVSSTLIPSNGHMALVYVDPTLGIQVTSLNPNNCAPGAPKNVRAADTYLSVPPVIEFNGVNYAIAYDDFQTGRVGVATLDENLDVIDDVDVGVGRRPSITWASDRWVLRADGTVHLYGGSFQSDHCFNTVDDADETDVDCGGSDCAPCD